MKKLLIALFLIILSFTSLYYFSNLLNSNNQDNYSNEINETPTSQESKNSLVPDEALIPYSELPNYEYTSKTIILENNNQTIFGQCLLPEGMNEKVPLVICCHGLGADLFSCFDYGEIFAQKGLGAFLFDFRGGGGTRSEGLSTDMSVMTEVSDLEVVLENAKSWEFIDPNKIVLFGESQGGLVAAITAARHPQEVAGLILEYPAFVIDDTIKSFEINTEELPESFNLSGITIGKRYLTDMIGFDSYEEIKKYKKHVLILQGDMDKIVPQEYSKKAADTFNDAEYFIINGASHGFNEEEFNQSLVYIFNYLERIGIIQV